jgi:small-conductance mechanosensitive channel
MATESILGYIPLLSIVFSSMGFSLVFKDFIADLVASMVIRKIKDIKVGNRIKISSGGSMTKGDIMQIGLLRTTVMEVGDGERLPSVRTGRLIKVPNYLLISSPVMIYGDTIIDEVVSYIPRPFPDSQLLVDSMKEAIVSSGHGLIEVGLYQSKDDKLVVHGVFEVQTSEMSDERSRILLEFLARSQHLIASAAQPKSEQQGSIQVQERKITLPLQNMESPRS